MTQEQKDGGIRGNSIRESQKNAWEWRNICLEVHAADIDDQAESPQPRYFNAVLDYFLVLRPYLEAEERMSGYWEDIEIDVEELRGTGLKQLNDWCFKSKTESRGTNNPAQGRGVQQVTRPEFIGPRGTTKILNVLDDAAKKLGFLPNCDTPTKDVRIREQDVEAAMELIVRKAEEHAKEETNGEV